MSVVKRTFPREFKLDLCERVKFGKVTKTAVCREHCLSPSLLDYWMRQYDARGQDAFSDGAPVDMVKRVKELEASLGRAHLENDFLREALGKLRVPVKRQL